MHLPTSNEAASLAGKTPPLASVDARPSDGRIADEQRSSPLGGQDTPPLDGLIGAAASTPSDSPPKNRHSHYVLSALPLLTRPAALTADSPYLALPSADGIARAETEPAQRTAAGPEKEKKEK